MIEFFVQARLSNPLNGSHGHWAPKAKAKRALREAARYLSWSQNCEACMPANAPKRATFLLHTWNPWDDDALAAACKPIRDGLIDARVIHSDAHDSGHEFKYSQVVDRKRRGVTVTVEVR